MVDGAQTLSVGSKDHPGERYAHGGATLAGKFYIYGGAASGGRALDDLWMLDLARSLS